MIQHVQLTPVLEFLEISQPKCCAIINNTVWLSEAALACMNQVRFAPSNQNNVFDTDDQKTKLALQEKLLSIGSKRKAPKDGEDLHAVQQK